MKLIDWFTKGMTFEEYVQSMQVNKEELLHIYNEVSIPEDTLSLLKKAQEKAWKVVVLTADWCGDAMLCVPILKRICEEANFDMRFLIRDENLELMDQYLTNGTSRAIPIFIFMDAEGNETAVWGPRSQEVQDMITSLRAALPEKDDPAFEEKQKEMYTSFRTKLATDTEIWTTVVNSAADCLRPALL
jgi:hypothetical protein